MQESQVNEVSIDIEFNEVYEPVFTSKARYIDAWGGRGRGGSHFGTDYFLFMITKPQYFRGYFLRQNFTDIRDSLFSDFKDRIEDNPTINKDLFHINEHEMRITYLPTGNQIKSKGARKEGGRTAKLKSLAGATHVLIEEADEMGEEDFDQLDISLRTIKADVQIIRIFNPPHKQHWIWRDYVLQEAPRPADWTDKEYPYYLATPKSTSNVLSIRTTYLDNIRNVQPSTVELFEGYKTKKPEYYYTTIKGLISEGQRGRIFSGWNKITNDDFNQVEARSIFGLDFGSTDPMALVETKIVRNRLYLREQVYKTNITLKQLAIILCEKGFTDKDLIIADSAEPKSISKLRQGWTKDELSEEEIEKYPQLLKGFHVMSAIKGPDSIKFGIDLLMDYEVYATDDSDNLWREYREYKWALDKNKNPTDEPEDKNNHLIDPTRYVVMGKGRFF